MESLFGRIKSAINLSEMGFFTLALAPGNPTSVSVEPCYILLGRSRNQAHFFLASQLPKLPEMYNEIL